MTDRPASTDSTTCSQPPVWRQEWKKFISELVVLITLFALPLGWQRFDQSISEALAFTKWYTQEHVFLCLVPAFVIAGAIGVFISQNAVMKYLGPKAPKPLALGMASVNGSILAAIPPAILVFALPIQGLWVLLPFSAAVVGLSLFLETSNGEGEQWFNATWTFTKQILPLVVAMTTIAVRSMELFSNR